MNAVNPIETKRLLLDDILRKSFSCKPYVYYQPPSNIRMKYPAILYKRDDIKKIPADDITYLSSVRWIVTVMDCDPDSMILYELLQLPGTHFVQHYTKDNLNYDVFTIDI